MVTRAEIGKRISLKTGRPKKAVGEVVASVLDAIKEGLERGESVKVSGFGKFVVRDKRARKGRNPQTGGAVTITRRPVVSFKACRVLKRSM
jgi:integration host factor subunit alpha